MVRFNTLSTLSSGGTTGVMGEGYFPPLLSCMPPQFLPPPKKKNSVKIRQKFDDFKSRSRVIAAWGGWTHFANFEFPSDFSIRFTLNFDNTPFQVLKA